MADKDGGMYAIRCLWLARQTDVSDIAKISRILFQRAIVDCSGALFSKPPSCLSILKPGI